MTETAIYPYVRSSVDKRLRDWDRANIKRADWQIARTFDERLDLLLKSVGF